MSSAVSGKTISLRITLFLFSVFCFLFSFSS